MLPVVPYALLCARQTKKHIAARTLNFRIMKPSFSTGIAAPV